MVERFKELIKATVHIGHQKTRWCPKMAPYIWGHKNGIHLFDVSKVDTQLEKAAKFLESVAASGKPILWVGTKKAAQQAVADVAGMVNMPSVTHRWIGGTLSNYPQVKKSVTKLLHFEDIVAKAEKFPHYTKKEISVFQKNIERLQKNVGGIRKLTWPVGAVVLVDVLKEHSALKEAAVMGVPVVALVDTNGDPSLVDYVIPSNDDSPKSIKYVIDRLGAAVQQGLATLGERPDVEVEVVEIGTTDELSLRALEEDVEEGSAGKNKSEEQQQPAGSRAKRTTPGRRDDARAPRRSSKE
jgi:small subunit ribosomal protein S2